MSQKKNNYHVKNLTMNEQKGITLVALVVTIVVLLILAGVTIATLFSDNGIITKAEKAKDDTETSSTDELQKLTNIENKMNEILNNTEKVVIQEGLEIGTTVLYNPSGEYNWQGEYSWSNNYESTTADKTLSSAEGGEFKISKWKVLDIDNNTGNITLIANAPTNGTVSLGGAQGYNNGVKLLNDACAKLYGNKEKSISARSINIRDIEYYMTEDAKTGPSGAFKYSNSAKYGEQEVDFYQDMNTYPTIYAQEKLSEIDGIKKETGLDLIDSPQNFIGKSDEGALRGEKVPETSTRPYQTYWSKDATYMQAAFRNYDKGNYYNLIMPGETDASYWLASRCIDTYSVACRYVISYVSSGSILDNVMFYSNSTHQGSSCAMLPIVTVNYKFISGNATSGFTIE